MKKLILLTICLLYGFPALCQSQLERGKQYYQWEEYTRALPLLQQAAKEGYGEACYLLGKMYYYGSGTEKNYTIAMRMYQRGLEFGYNLGNVELGMMYESGNGCTADPKKAFDYYCKSKEAGDKLGIYLIARCYLLGIGTEENTEQAYTLFSSLYKDYEFKNQYKWAHQFTCVYLGRCHQNGWGTEIDLNKTVEYFKNSEKPDYLFQASRLIKLHGLSGDWKQLLNSAVWNGCRNGQALYEYAKMELARWGKIDEKTLNYLVEAAETYPPALKLLGDCYRLGYGTTINMVKAREWYDKAEAKKEEIEKIEREEQQRIAAAKQAEKDHIEREKAEQKEQQRIAAAKQAEKDRIEREKAEQEAARINQARLAAATRYKKGDLYQEDEKKGVVIKHDGNRILIIALTGYFGPWPGHYANCKEGWRLPTRDELEYIQSNKEDVNNCLSSFGGVPIRSGVYYWSAAQGYRTNERIASNGSEISRDQSNKNYIRLVRDF